MPAQERDGFIGLGPMGAPMAGNLLEAGYEVSRAMHRRPPPDEPSRGLGCRLDGSRMDDFDCQDHTATWDIRVCGQRI